MEPGIPAQTPWCGAVSSVPWPQRGHTVPDQLPRVLPVPRHLNPPQASPQCVGAACFSGQVLVLHTRAGLPRERDGFPQGAHGIVQFITNISLTGNAL